MNVGLVLYDSQHEQLSQISLDPHLQSVMIETH